MSRDEGILSSSVSLWEMHCEVPVVFRISTKDVCRYYGTTLADLQIRP